MLVNELVSSCNLEALLMADPNLFANMVVPEGMEKAGVRITPAWAGKRRQEESSMGDQ